MKKAFAVIGANFGDEGKGLMTDLLCREHDNVIDIRFNGGAQAGHTVCTPDGRRHVFSHIGAGAFAGADTFLSEFFIVNPMLFMREFADVGEFAGNIFVDRRCAVTLPCDIMLNQFAERQRCNDRHGSCGVGIFETICRSRIPRFSLTVGEITDTPEFRSTLADKIRRINSEYCIDRAAELGITGEYAAELKMLLANENIIVNFIADLMDMLRICRITDEQIIENYDTAVFEGAQGLLLGMERDDYFPNLTPSDTGMKNVRSILDRLSPRDTEVCYVTRSFFTRHGAGRFDSECSSFADDHGLYDKTNAPNEFQGKFRYGWFDLSEFMNSIAIDLKYVKNDERVSVAVTHLDMTDGRVLCETGSLMPEDIAYMLAADGLYIAYGETAEDISVRQVVAKALARR